MDGGEAKALERLKHVGLSFRPLSRRREMPGGTQHGTECAQALYKDSYRAQWPESTAGRDVRARVTAGTRGTSACV